MRHTGHLARPESRARPLPHTGWQGSLQVIFAKHVHAVSLSLQAMCDVVQRTTEKECSRSPLPAALPSLITKPEMQQQELQNIHDNNSLTICTTRTKGSCCCSRHKVKHLLCCLASWRAEEFASCTALWRWSEAHQGLSAAWQPESQEAAARLWGCAMHTEQGGLALKHCWKETRCGEWRSAEHVSSGILAHIRMLPS